MILTPYFLSKPSTEAITTLAQSVSGMKPIFTSSFSGLSEPWAQTAARRAGSTARGADGGGLQDAASAEAGGEQVGHGSGLRLMANKNKKGKKLKGVRTAQGLLENEPLRDGDAFVRFGGSHPPLGAACLKAGEGLCAGCLQAVCQPLRRGGRYRESSSGRPDGAGCAGYAGFAPRRAAGTVVVRCTKLNVFSAGAAARAARGRARAGSRPSTAPTRPPR